MLTFRHRFVRMIVIVMASIGLVAATTGCTRVSTSEDSDQSGTSTLDSVLNAGVLKVASCLSFKPFGFTTSSGSPTGYDVDIANALAKEMGVEVEVVNTTSSNRIPYLQTKKVDVVICNFTRTLERAKQIAFSDPYVVATEGILVNKSSGIATADDLKGKKVAVVKGSTNADVLSELGIDVTIQQYDSSEEAFMAVEGGQADATIEDSNGLNYQASIHDDLMVVTDERIPLEYNALGIGKGDQIWLNYLNQFLFEFNTSGENSELYTKWFGTTPTFKLNPDY